MTNIAELRAALADALQRTGPVLIDCRIDKDERVLPMIPAGGTVDDIVADEKGENTMEKYILSVIVQNNAGVLGARVQPVRPPRLQH